MTDEAKPKTLLEALHAVQAETIRVGKSGKNAHFSSKYVTLADLHAAVMPILNKHGLVWLTFPENGSEGPVLRYELVNKDAQPAPMQYAGTYGEPRMVIGGIMPLLLDKQNPQGLGSAITYARRQSLMAVVGIVGEDDDDGERASKATVRLASVATPLGTDGHNKLMHRISEKGANLDLLLAAVGASDAKELSKEQGEKMWRMLDD